MVQRDIKKLHWFGTHGIWNGSSYVQLVRCINCGLLAIVGDNMESSYVQIMYIREIVIFLLHHIQFVFLDTEQKSGQMAEMLEKSENFLRWKKYKIVHISHWVELLFQCLWHAMMSRTYWTCAIPFHVR